MKKNLVLSACLLFFLTGCQTSKVKERTDYENYCYEINKIQFNLKTCSCKKLYDAEPFDNLKQRVMEEQLPLSEVNYEILKNIESYNVAHLRYHLNDDNSLMQEILPLSFKHFEEGYYVWSTAVEYKQYMFQKLEKVGGLNADEFAKTIGKNRGYETKNGEYSILQTYILFAELKYYGLLNENGQIEVTLRDEKGNLVNLEMPSVSVTDWNNTPWENMDNYAPIYRNVKSGRNYCMSPDEKNGIMTIHYFSCYDDNTETFEEFYKGVLETLKSGKYDTVVFDLRYNGGGNSGTAEVPIDINKKELDGYNIGLVIGSDTYSAGCQFLNYILETFDKVTFFGSETGQAINNYTRVQIVELECLKAKFVYPTVVDQVDALKKRAVKMLSMQGEIDEQLKSVGTEPDVYLREKYSDFVSGKDTIYEGIVKYYANR